MYLLLIGRWLCNVCPTPSVICVQLFIYSTVCVMTLVAFLCISAKIESSNVQSLFSL